MTFPPNGKVVLSFSEEELDALDDAVDYYAMSEYGGGDGRHHRGALAEVSRAITQARRIANTKAAP